MASLHFPESSMLLELKIEKLLGILLGTMNQEVNPVIGNDYADSESDYDDDWVDQTIH
jgi:hypothetical protein